LQQPRRSLRHRVCHVVVRGIREHCYLLDERSCPPQNLSLALGAIAIHRSGLETALFQPALDPVFGEADI